MKKLVKMFICVLFVVALMFAEYRIIMSNLVLHVYDTTVTIDIFGHSDHYTIDGAKLEEIKKA